MGKRILITGGAGFIGSHLADQLLALGHTVKAYDNLSPQVHGPDAGRPDYLAPEVELIVGDVRDERLLRRALEGIDVVYHLAAVVGVGQSMSQIARYTEINDVGTGKLLDLLARKPVERLIVASSMSVYGEGHYVTADGDLIVPTERNMADLKRGEWELLDQAGRPLSPVPTDESKPCSLPSVYAMTKYATERLALIVGRAYEIPTVALRFFNTYGPRQALSNPYTGVLAIFAARLLSDRPPLINEDGLQRRDFVSVHDIARACVKAMTAPAANGLVVNVGSGRSFSVAEVAERLAIAVGKPHILPRLTGDYRPGDIRHCFPDITRARRELGYQPAVTLDDGLQELAQWLLRQPAAERQELIEVREARRGVAS
jgi:dTDP-L-rhamnose 4-epimerase